MNTIHDMGGMQNMGSLQYEKNELVFHAEWERRMFAMALATNHPPGMRYHIESIPPADYLRMSYYEKWLTAFVNLLLRYGIIASAELESGKAAPGMPKGKPLTAAEGLAQLAKGYSRRRDQIVSPRFQIGQRVKARNMNPLTHTRLPRYARGRLGTIEQDHGVFRFEDTAFHQLGENPQHLYTVRFAARELWGQEARGRDSVYVDMWEAYLEPA